MAEHYIRPPLVAREAPSRRAAAIRFWLVFGIFIAAIVVGVFLLFQLITSPTEGSPAA